MTRTQRVKAFWPIAAGISPASVTSATTTVFADTNILAGDTAFITPANSGAAALMGNAAGLFVTAADGTVTITHAAAAGGELFNVVVIPAGMTTE